MNYKYVIEYKEIGIMDWKEKDKVEVCDTREQAQMTAKIGRDIFKEFDHKITKMNTNEVISLLQRKLFWSI